MGSAIQPTGGIRKLWTAERELFRAHLFRLDAESLRNRFAMTVGEEFLNDYAERCFANGDLIYVYTEDGMVRASAELRPLATAGADSAEVAFSVEVDWRNRGIGAALFDRMITAAGNRGYRKLHMNCLAWNRPMQALARKFKASLHFETGDIVGTVIADTRNPATFVREAVENMHSFTTAVLDLQARQISRWQRLTGQTS